jgi:hypothetical protein
VTIDPDGDGDLFDDSAFFEYYVQDSPFTSPVSLTRAFQTQTRVSGPDGELGTADDGQVLYGGQGGDVTAYHCLGQSVCFGMRVMFGNLEYWDSTLGPVYTGVNEMYLGHCDPTIGCLATCAAVCNSPGDSPIPRQAHVAVARMNDAGGAEVVLLGGTSYDSPFYRGPFAGCASATEVISADPGGFGMRYSSVDPIDWRGQYHAASLFPRSQNILLSGGSHMSPGNAWGTADVQYVQFEPDAMVPVTSLSSRRDLHTSVSVPGGTIPGVEEDRAYIFGGLDRDNSWTVFWGTNCLGTTLNTAEYYEEAIQEYP